MENIYLSRLKKVYSKKNHRSVLIEIVDDKIFGKQKADLLREEFNKYSNIFKDYDVCLDLSNINFFDSMFINVFRTFDCDLKNKRKTLSLIVPMESVVYEALCSYKAYEEYELFKGIRLFDDINMYHLDVDYKIGYNDRPFR